MTIHDTATDGTAAFDANAPAKNNSCPDEATPLKRPENGKFLPGSDFSNFVFDPTGDTNHVGLHPGAAERGAWGRPAQADHASKRAPRPARSSAGCSAMPTTRFDNLAFLDAHTLLASEDRGDTLHAQLNMLDSIWAFDLTARQTDAKRFVALGRDPASETDVNIGALPCLATNTCGFTFQNEGDNEPSGIHVSDGDPDAKDLLGSDPPGHGAHAFFTQQHGENHVFEIVLQRDH